MSLHNIDRTESWNGLTHEQKNHELFLREKEMLDLFLAHGAITRAQHDKSLHDLTEKMGEVQRILKFSSDRDWDQFHTPANLAKSISIEANELLECFQWDEDHYDREAVSEELADVMVYCIDMLDRLNLDADEIINAKMDKNEAKYPVEKARGVATKYDKL